MPGVEAEQSTAICGDGCSVVEVVREARRGFSYRGKLYLSAALSPKR
jgi:hypothetical protein